MIAAFSAKKYVILLNVELLNFLDIQGRTEPAGRGELPRPTAARDRHQQVPNCQG